MERSFIRLAPVAVSGWVCIIGACDRQRPAMVAPPAAPGVPATASGARSTAAATRAAKVWYALTATPPDFQAASTVLASPDAIGLRDTIYAAPDPMESTVDVGGTRVDLTTTAFAPMFRALLAWVKEDVPARVNTVVGLDHMLAGIMGSVPQPKVSRAGLLTGSLEPGMAYTSAALLRVVVLNELDKLGEPAAHHQPATRRDACIEITKAIGRNQPVPPGPVP